MSKATGRKNTVKAKRWDFVFVFLFVFVFVELFVCVCVCLCPCPKAGASQQHGTEQCSEQGNRGQEHSEGKAVGFRLCLCVFVFV